MSEIHAIISELEAYSAKAGIQPSTICVRARNNPRLYDRLKTRAEKLEEDIAALRKWMAENPAEDRRGAA